MILVVLAVTALVVGASAWYASNRTPPAFDPPDEAAVSTAPTTAPPDRTPVLAFYGDWFVSGTDEGGLGPAGWPAIVSERVGAKGTPPHAVADAGYVADSAITADTFVTLAENSPERDADVTIVFGGRNDYLAEPAEITAAATRTFQAIRAAAPETQLLVIGPAWSDAAVPEEIPPIRDAVQQAAVGAGATFVDPLTERWFFDDLGLFGADVISPTDAGHLYLADRIEPVVRQLLSTAPGAEASETAAPTG